MTINKFASLFNPEALKELATILSDTTKDGQNVKAEVFLGNNGFLAELPIAREKARRGPDKTQEERKDEDIEKSLTQNRIVVLQTLVREGLLDGIVEGVSFTHFLGKNGGLGQMAQPSTTSQKDKKSSDRKLDPAFIESLRKVLEEHLPEGKILTRNEIASLLGATVTNVAKMEADISAALNSVPDLIEKYARKPGVGGGTCLKSTLLLLEKAKNDKNKESPAKTEEAAKVEEKESANQDAVLTTSVEVEKLQAVEASTDEVVEDDLSLDLEEDHSAE